MKKPIAIFGAGGLGREVLMLIQHINSHLPEQWQPIGFFDDGIEAGQLISGLPVLGDLVSLNKYAKPLAVVVAIGSTSIKKQLVESIQNERIYFPVLIHPSVLFLPEQQVAIGEGSILCAGTMATVNITIGRHVLLNLQTTVGHDAQIGDFCSLMPAVNVSGEVTLGEGVYAGTNASFKPQISVGAYTTIGMGATVTKSLPAYCTAVGVPARIINYTPPML